jgi:hypothetical protein
MPGLKMYPAKDHALEDRLAEAMNKQVVRWERQGKQNFGPWSKSESGQAKVSLFYV